MNKDSIVCLPPEKIAFIGTTIATELACNKSIEEITTISSLLGQICSTLNTIKCQMIIYEKHCNPKKNS